MDPKAGLAHYAFTIKDANESVSEQLRASAHFLLGYVCRPMKTTAERLFLFFSRILNSNGLRTLAATGVIYKWDQLESVGFESYMEMIEKRKKLHLVLDLDATLIWAVPHADIDEDTRKTGFRLRNEAYDMCVRFRPGVDRFLMEMGRYFEISIYTAAELRYAQELVEKANQRGWTMIKNELTDHIPWSEIIPTSRIISSGKEGAVGAELKNLQNTHLYYNRTKKWETVVIVDDNVNSWIPSNRHYIYPIQQFTGDPKDQYLTQCAEYLIRFYVDFFQRNSNNFSRTLSTL